MTIGALKCDNFDFLILGTWDSFNNLINTSLIPIETPSCGSTGLYSVLRVLAYSPSSLVNTDPRMPGGGDYLTDAIISPMCAVRQYETITVAEVSTGRTVARQW